VILPYYYAVRSSNNSLRSPTHTPAGKPRKYAIRREAVDGISPSKVGYVPGIQCPFTFVAEDICSSTTTITALHHYIRASALRLRGNSVLDPRFSHIDYFDFCRGLRIGIMLYCASVSDTDLLAMRTLHVTLLCISPLWNRLHASGSCELLCSDTCSTWACWAQFSADERQQVYALQQLVFTSRSPL